MPAYEVTLTSKGQITIPAELRAKLNLKEGDKLEFYLDRSGRVLMRPRNLSPTAVFENAPRRVRPAAAKMTDDEAIIAAVLEKDRRSRRRHRAA
jgi:AbrB family looped-hinge helix DNA binding protein